MTSTVAHRLHVLICDDHEVSRAGLQAVVHSAPDLIVVGHAASSARAVELSRELTPHVALVTQGLGGHESRVVRTLSRGGVGVIVLGPAGADPGVVDALRAGARCYLTQAVAPAQLITAIRAAARGETTLDPQAVAPLLLPASGPARPTSELDEVTLDRVGPLRGDPASAGLFDRISSASLSRLVLREVTTTKHYVRALLRCRAEQNLARNTRIW